jgi:hypothetical protein
MGAAGLTSVSHLASLDPASGLLLLVLSWVAAAWGPVLIPLGILFALLDGRRRGGQDGFGWVVLAAAIVAALATHCCLLKTVEWP